MTAQFNINLTNSISKEELEQMLLDFMQAESSEATAEHEMLVDATQLLTLGGIKLREVYGSAVFYAKKENDYNVGRTFDVFDISSLKYGDHVTKTTGKLTPASIVSQAMVMPGSPRKSRLQFQINSELKTDSNGRSYYEILRRNHYVTSNVYGPWSAFDKKNGARRTHKLYVVDAAKQVFRTNKEGQVALGLVSIYDQVINDIYATGVVRRYEQILNAKDQTLVEALSEHQQLLFLEVFKTLKPELEAAEAEAEATSTEPANA